MSTSLRQSQVSLLQSQAKHVFTREAFKSAVWVGAAYDPDSDDMDFQWIVIVYDPDYSEDEVWELYRSCEQWSEDPDRPKLKHAWGRRVKIRRIFQEPLRHWEDVEALFHAETLHGDFDCQVLQTLRSLYYEKAIEYHLKLSKSMALVENLMAGSTEACKQAHKIGKILEGDTMDIMTEPKGLASLAEKLESTRTLQALKMELCNSLANVDLLLDHVSGCWPTWPCYY
jgi:hypothetical protein